MSMFETFFETLSRIPGLGFLEKYGKDIRTARYTVRSSRERAEELSERASDVKDAAGVKKKSGGSDKSGTGRMPKKAERDLRAKSRRRGGDDLGEPTVRKPRRKVEFDDGSKSQVRDTSPGRDRGRSLRKRKGDL